jgi:hypothetical protein
MPTTSTVAPVPHVYVAVTGLAFVVVLAVAGMR